MQKKDVEITLKKCQFAVHESEARFRVLAAGRRFGKTYLAIAEMLHWAREKDRVVWYVAPNEQQAKGIAWVRLKQLTERFWAKPPNETERRIDLIWGSTLFVKGAFKPENLRGIGVDFLVLDEYGHSRLGLGMKCSEPRWQTAKGGRCLSGHRRGAIIFIT